MCRVWVCVCLLEEIAFLNNSTVPLKVQSSFFQKNMSPAADKEDTPHFQIGFSLILTLVSFSLRYALLCEGL